MKSATYKVTGFAMVPWECEIHVEAVNREEAMQKAREIFESERARCLVGQGQDTSSVCDFEPSEAVVLK